MHRKNLLAFVAMTVLVGAIAFTATSDIFAQANNATTSDDNSEETYNGSLIDRIMAQNGKSGGDDEEEDDAAGDDDAEDEEDEKKDGDDKEFTDSFMAESCTFNATGSNPFFVLEPGYQLAFEGEEDGEEAELTITVLDETRVVDGTETRMVEEREVEGGELVEVSRNYFAICEETNSVFYFGEEVDMYEDGELVSHEGAWLAGEDGNKAGIIMPGTILLGARHYQEVAPGVALDRAEIVEMDEEVETPAGRFENVLVVRETTPLEPGVEELKYYAQGIGLLQDKELKLVRYGTVEE